MMYTDWIVTNFLVALALVLVCSYVYNWIRSRNYPPGPHGLPVVGYIPFLGKKPNLTLENLSKKYGDIFSFYIGPQLMICVSDYVLIKEILNHPLTLARPPQAFAFLVGNGGFSGQNGEAWQEQRRFVVQTMRNLGLGKGLWETMIQEDSAELIKEIQKENGEPYVFNEPLARSQISNSLSLLFGRHLDPEAEKENIELMSLFSRKMMDHVSSVNLNVILPWLTKFMMLFNVFGFQEFMNLLRKIEDIFKKEVEKRMNAKEELTKDDFIGCYLQEIEKRKNDSQPHSFNGIEIPNMYVCIVAQLQSMMVISVE
ncbi:cytochrome P450 18a1 [Nephila pilipes]|uniref:Cytochrome P450 18a1 n=1 Tax=Nephila pilipes TaxID=299642 RepID=A0A8X6IH56_NEPPI|nr:cytochrome P450 18a1 [Nephila pilipes]